MPYNKCYGRPALQLSQPSEFLHLTVITKLTCSYFGARKHSELHDNKATVAERITTNIVLYYLPDASFLHRRDAQCGTRATFWPIG